MRFSWPIVGTLIGAGLGLMTMPLDIMIGRPSSWWIQAWPVLTASLGLITGIAADYFRFR